MALEMVRPSTLALAILSRARIEEADVGLLVTPEVFQFAEAFGTVVEAADVILERG